jgi:intracellular sulfur oxidation DsrE/DsrF family protein
MAKRILAVLETAYRGTLEEQDDTVVWLVHAMKDAGADVTVVLRGAAVNYAARGQDASGLAFGKRRQTQPPRIDVELSRLARKGVRVLAIREDTVTRGLDGETLIEGVDLVPYAAIAQLCASHQQVWHW